MERSKKRGKSKCFILRWKFSVVRFQLSEVSLTQRRRGLAEGFLVFSCQFSVVSHTRHAGFWLGFTCLGYSCLVFDGCARYTAAAKPMSHS